MSGLSNNNNNNMMNTSATRSGTAYNAHIIQVPSTSVGHDDQHRYGNLSNHQQLQSNWQTQGSQLGQDAMTRSEEQLRVNKATVPAGKAELNKWVETEHVQQAVPVTRETAVLQREPINPSNMNQAMKGPAISEAHYETTLKKDVVTAQNETVPVERIRLAKQVEQGYENIGADLRKEHIDLGVDQTTGGKFDNIGRSQFGQSNWNNDKIDSDLGRSQVTQSNWNNSKIDSGLGQTSNATLGNPVVPSTEKARTETY